jgi:hypothetical protein
MFKWLKKRLLNRVYRKTIKHNAVSVKNRSLKKINIISIIFDHRLGVDKEHFQRIGNHFNIPKKNVRILTFFQSQKQINEANLNRSYTSKNISKYLIHSLIKTSIFWASTSIIKSFNL